MIVVAIVARLSLILADLIVVVVTWSKTFPIMRAGSHFGFTSQVGMTLMRDGECHIGCMFATRTANPYRLSGSAYFV